MTRARARELTLVNWKGVFFERYLLDPNVTALEGDNGAGKTTVMIAAYVTLLPDLSRLRFTNLGETGATGGDRGIWGRLGEPSRPSFSAITLELGDGSHVIAGVHLKRKSEPTLELAPFLIGRLPVEARARDFLLETSATHDEIPTLDGVKQLVAAAGAEIEVFSTSKAYFAALFDLGISPMRLSSDEERNKYNDMLRTSMTGGISRALTSELRSFVFKQELGLSDTLGRMRTNLNACRKTRLEVADSRELQRHITGVFEAGQSMFRTAMMAARTAADEQAEQCRAAQRALSEAETHVSRLSLELSEAKAQAEGIEDRLTALSLAHDKAKQRVVSCQRALQTAERIETLTQELAGAEERLHAARARHQDATDQRRRKRELRDESQRAVTQSAQGLANLQAGLEELHRRAYSHRRAHQELDRAAAALAAAIPEDAKALDLVKRIDLARSMVTAAQPAAESDRIAPPTDDLSTLLLELRKYATDRLLECDSERARRHRESESAQLQRQDRDRALQALSTLVERLPDDQYVEAARHALSLWDERERLVSALPSLRSEVDTLSATLERQTHARARATAAGLDPNTLTGSALHQALGALDAEYRDLRERAREASWKSRETSETVEQLGNERRRTEPLVARFRELEAAAERLKAFGLTPHSSQADLDQTKSELEDRLARVERRHGKLVLERDRALTEANALEGYVGGTAPELVELRDVVDGEFLSNRFEELEPEDASYVEALLGPLKHAVVVEDMDAARERLRTFETPLDDVWLVRAGADLKYLDRPRPSGEIEAVVESDGIVRISRIPELSSLGRRARERRAQVLRRTAQERQRALEEEERAQRKLRTELHDLDKLRQRADLWRSGDPAQRLEALDEELTRARAEATQSKERAERDSKAADQLHERMSMLRTLLPDAALFDAADIASRLEECQRRLCEAESFSKELERVAEARGTLARLLDALKSEPPSEQTLTAWQSEREALAEQRDQLFRAVEALDQVLEQEHAFAYGDAVESLGKRSELVPELERQHADLQQQAQTIETKLAELEQEWEAASDTLQAARAEHAAISAHIERALKELADEGVSAPTRQTLEDLATGEQEAKRTLDDVARDARDLNARVALAEERHHRALERRDALLSELAQAEKAALPLEEAWTTAQREATTQSLVALVDDRAPSANSRALWAEAEGKRALLFDRLRTASGGSLSDDFGEGETSFEPLGYVALWKNVRQWLQKRLPAQVADVQDPVLALSRLQDDLVTLEGRLRQQESELLGASGDVARSIDVQVRRATGQIRRINQYLSDITFGSIQGIRVTMERVEAMGPILEALRNGNAQKLLFQGNLPLEEALDEIFKRYGGGRSGGHRILDYREYIELKVEVKRQGDGKGWELANPTRVSTGEAIGVGAALMMVILTEWERDATLLRNKRTHGSLRFLFLDEANRLSQDNLGVLFDLCQNLELQLLIAAPEVARAEGNTTYRLVRRVAEDGSEEVLVTGRRSQLPEAATEAAVVSPEPAREAAQQPLFQARD